ncbi:hypothetical protein Tco_1442335, partial [Tanacetum coccineum]
MSVVACLSGGEEIRMKTEDMILSFMVRHEVDEGRTKGVAVIFTTHLAATVAVAAARPMVSTVVLSLEDNLPRSKLANDEEGDG